MIELKMAYLMMGLGFVAGFAMAYALGVYHGYRESFDDMAKARSQRVMDETMGSLRRDVDELRKGVLEVQRTVLGHEGRLDGR